MIKYSHMEQNVHVVSKNTAMLIGALLLNLFFPCAFAQETFSDSLIQIRFLAEETHLHQPVSCFNILEITNRSDQPVTGIVRVSSPERWQIIWPQEDTIALNAGDSQRLPVRISMPGDILGGIAYVITGEFFNNEVYASSSTYISTQQRSRWDMRLTTSQVYLTDFRPQGDLGILLTNTGNSSELIKLSFKPGHLLELKEKPEADSFFYVNLPAHQDTLLQLAIVRRSDLNYGQERAFSQNWRASTLDIHASTLDQHKQATVRATNLNSVKINKKPLLQAPLNLEAFQYNLLSDQPKKLTLKAFGTVLFPEDQMLDYFAGYYNLYFNPALNRDLDPFRQLHYSIRYTDPRSEIWINDRHGVGTLHTLSGRGIRVMHDFTQAGRVQLNVIQNPYEKNIGAHAGYIGMVGKVNLSGGLTAEMATDQQYEHYSAHLGGKFKLGARHYFDLQTATSLSQYAVSRYLARDTTLLGFAYLASYRFRGEKLQLKAYNSNQLFTYTRNSGINRSHVTADYRLNSNSLIKSHYYRARYASTKYPYNFAYPDDANVNEYARILASFQRGNVIYQVGPQYVGSIREHYSTLSDQMSRYVNYQPGILGTVTFRLDRMQSVTPNVSFNTMFYNYDIYATAEDDPAYMKRWTYSVGLNYYDRSFKLNALYTTGNSSDLYRNVVIGDDDVGNQAIHIRPYYERYFLKETLHLSAYLNYSYYMPSQRVNLMMSFTGAYNLNRTWKTFLIINAFRISRVDAELGRINLNDMNLMVGVRKSFDLQQPRLSYYDLVIVGFNDINGDGIRNGDEKPISNVLVNISRNENQSTAKRTGFAEISMITDPQGEIYYEKIPEGVYDLNIIPLNSLSNMFFLHGTQQSITIHDDMVYYLPLVESYKIRGRILIDRDPNSTLSGISAEGIRVNALAGNGEVFSALTDGFGAYTLTVPKNNTYEVKIYNVLGENFRIEQDSYAVRFFDQRTIQLDFKFIERRREIQFNEGDQYFRFNLDRR